MALFDTKQNAQVNSQNNEVNKGISLAMSQTDNNYQSARETVKEEICSLGKQYFEANKDNTDSEFYNQISIIKECIEKEKLWYQYRLSLEGKLQCDSCKAIITADSAFCNKCGASIKPQDFTLIGIPANQQGYIPSLGVCPSCGSSLVPGAAFCEKCGHKL